VGLQQNGGVFFDALVNGGQLDSNAFSYWVNIDDERATLILGGVDTAHMARAVTWLTTLSKSHWATPLGESIQIGSSSVQINIGSKYAIFDTGASGKHSLTV
jgi:hypothetical protein